VDAAESERKRRNPYSLTPMKKIPALLALLALAASFATAAESYKIAVIPKGRRTNFGNRFTPAP